MGGFRSDRFDSDAAVAHCLSMAKPVLGRGLSALLGGISTPSRPATAPLQPTPLPGTDVPSTSHQVGVLKLAIESFFPCPFQPRKSFPSEAQAELVESIRVHGVIQPLLVRKQGARYEIIAGERRWRAAQAVGLTELPAVIREADDRVVLELALIENLQREDLNPIEEALGYAELIQRFDLKQEEAAAKVGKNRASVANALRLLKLPPALQEHLRQGSLSVGHAKALLSLPSAQSQIALAEQVIAKGLNVRQTESLVAGQINPPSLSTPTSSTPVGAPKDPHVAAVENRLRERLGTKVQLRYAQGKGAIEIRYFSDDELHRLLDILGIQMD